ncbi:MAG: hydrogenase nickel incorporation protein HypB, partial [Pseudomonadota bacterium]
MCTVCGCAGDGATIEGHDQRKDHHHDHGHQHDHHHHSDGAIDYGAGAAGVHVAGQSQTRLVEIEQDILSKNDALAAANRRRFQEQGIIALNMMSSPGSGKTTLLVETLKALKSRPVAVIEGDQQTSNDAARIRETGTAAIQVNTGKGCHLDADMVGHAAAHLEMQPGTLLFIENVGNLVCPAAFDLGESRRVVLTSITEGEDKPLKYPEMFAQADVMVITKMDLLPHLNFDVDLL